jgi:choline dehydrogenase-like flavoprotein
MSDYDVIITGTGVGGGTLARHLAPSGKRILLVERGDWLRREPQNWLAQDVFVENRYVSPDTWYDAQGKPFQPQVHYFVGGATKLYGAALYRFRKEDFGEIRHHDGISPAWPISYEEMEPYSRRRSSSTTSMASEERTRLSLVQAHLVRTRPYHTSHGFNSWRTTWRPQAITRSMPPVVSCSTNPTCRTAHV